MIRLARGSSITKVSRTLLCPVGDGSSSSSSSARSRMFFRFLTEGGDKDGIKVVKTDEDLDGYWKGMESRVSNSTFRKRSAGNIGRGRVPRTDEDVWGEAGLYQCTSTCPRYIANTTVTCDHSCKKRSWQ